MRIAREALLLEHTTLVAVPGFDFDSDRLMTLSFRDARTPIQLGAAIAILTPREDLDRAFIHRFHLPGWHWYESSDTRVLSYQCQPTDAELTEALWEAVAKDPKQVAYIAGCEPEDRRSWLVEQLMIAPDEIEYTVPGIKREFAEVLEALSEEIR